MKKVAELVTGAENSDDQAAFRKLHRQGMKLGKRRTRERH